jgi:CRISPR-associated protein Cst2
MNTVFVTGYCLIDVDSVALNNLGKDETNSYDNATAVKKVVKNRKTYPYISGQAWRYWWRETLALEYGWNVSPTTREKSIAFTEADPVKYPDDDIFGYMRAEKKVSLTRVSPLKNSVLISVSPIKVANEWSVMARQEGDPVPYEKQVYSAIMKGMFSMDLDQLGTFSSQKRSGYLNITEEKSKNLKKDGFEEVDDLLAKNKKGEYLKRIRLAKDERIQRAKDVISSLKVISGGSKRTTNYADVTPKLIILAIQKGGNNPFSHISYDDNGVAEVSIDILKDISIERKNQFLSKIFVGKQKGFMNNLDSQISELSSEEFIKGGIVETIDKFTDEIEKYIP